MTNLTITAGDVGPVQVVQQFTGPAVETIVAGQWVRFDSSTGKVALGNGTTAAEAIDGGVALLGGAAGTPITFVQQGILDVGDALDSLNFGVAVYLSDTDGTLADSAGTVSKVVGMVVPGWGHTTADKLLWLKGAL